MTNTARILIVCVVFALSACAEVRSDASCQRKFGDKDVEGLLYRQVPSLKPGQVYVNWKNCTYYVLYYPLPVTPDEQKLFSLDSSGKLLERREY